MNNERLYQKKRAGISVSAGEMTSDKPIETILST
jgi:hypothetical protein